MENKSAKLQELEEIVDRGIQELFYVASEIAEARQAIRGCHSLCFVVNEIRYNADKLVYWLNNHDEEGNEVR